MIKNFIIDNKKKIIIIGIVIAFIIGIISAISYFVPKTGIFQRNINNISSKESVNVSDADVGGIVERWMSRGSNSLENNPNLYCIRKGKTFADSSEFEVVACYYVRGLDLKAYRGSGNTDFINAETDYKYHSAILYAMSPDYNYDDYSEYPNQVAVWAVADWFYKTESGWGYDYGKSGRDYIYELSGDQRKTAEDAITFADYMWQRKQYYNKYTDQGIMDKTDKSNVTTKAKNIDGTDYVISGPYTIDYAHVQRTYDSDKVSKFGSIAVYDYNGNKVNDGIQVCDKDGNYKSEGAKYISNNGSFYLRVKASELGSGKKFTIYYEGKKLTDQSEYYYLRSIESDKQELVEGDAFLTTFKDQLNIDIDPIGTRNEEKINPVNYSFNIEKVDDNFAQSLQGADFRYTLHNGGDKGNRTYVEYKQGTIQRKNGGFDTTTITIDQDIYNLMQDKGNYKDCYITIEETMSPNGYRKIQGNIEIQLIITRSDPTVTTTIQDNIQITKKEYNLNIQNQYIKNNTDKSIKVNNETLNSNAIKEVEGNSTFSFKVPNELIYYPEYTIELQKYGTDGSEMLKDAKFQVKIGPQNATSDTSKDVFEITTSAIKSVGDILEDGYLFGDVNKDGAINNDDISAIRSVLSGGGNINTMDINQDGNISNMDITVLNKYYRQAIKAFSKGSEEQIRIEKSEQDGNFTIHIKNIKYTGTLKVEINEIKAPNGYEKINDSLILSIPIDSDRNIGNVTAQGTTNGNVGYNVTINQNQSKASIRAQDKKVNLFGSDVIRFEKITDEGNNNIVPLEGIEFTLYDVDNKNLGTFVTNENGYTENFEVEYKYENSNFTVGQIVDIKEYKLKETKTREGYSGLSENEEIAITMYGVAVSTQNNGVADTIKTGYIAVQNKTQSDIYYREKEGNEIQIKSLSSNETVILYDSNVISREQINNAAQKYCDISGLSSSIKSIMCLIKNNKVVIPSENQYCINISKFDPLNNNAVQGAEFALYDEANYKPGVQNRTAVSTATTGSNGVATLNIPLNNVGTYRYYIQETRAPEGYWILKSDEYVRVDIKVDYDRENNTYIISEMTFVNGLAIESGRTINVVSNVGNGQEYRKTVETCYDTMDPDAASIKKVTIPQNELGTITVNIPNDKKTNEGKFNIGIIKEDSTDSGIKLSGAEFTLTDSNGRSVLPANTTLVTDGSGNAVSSDITITENDWSKRTRTIIIKEIATPEGYIKLGGNEHVKLELFFKEDVINNVKQYSVEKINVTNNTSMEIGVNNKSLGQLNVNQDEYGDYNYQTEQRDRLEPGSTCVCDAEQNPTITIIIPNEPKEEPTNEGKFNIGIIKEDSTDSGIKLSGAEFTLTDSNGRSVLPANTTLVTDGSGNAVSSDITITENDWNERSRTILLKEIATPEGYVQLSGNEHVKLELFFKEDVINNVKQYTVEKINVTNNTSMAIGVNNSSEQSDRLEPGSTCVCDAEQNPTITIIIPNEPKEEPTNEGKFNIGIIKEDSTDSGIKLSGAEFTLTDSNGRSVLPANTTLVTDGSGNAVSSDIAITKNDWSGGTRTIILKEIATPEGYIELGENEHIKLELSFKEDVINDVKQYAVEKINVTNNTSMKIGVNNSSEQSNRLEPGSTCVCDAEQNPTITIIIPNQAQIDLALKKFIVSVDGNTINDRAPVVDTTPLANSTQAKYRFGDSNTEKTSLQPVEVSNGSIVRYKIRVYNEGIADAYAAEIRDYLPNGLEYVSSDVNSQYGWQYDQNTHSITTNYLSKDVNENMVIGAYNGGNLKYQDVEVELRVIEPDMYIGTLKNVAEISRMTAVDGKEIPQDIDSTANNTTIRRDGETIDDKYNPTTIDSTGKYYPDVANGEDDVDFEIVILKNPVIGGRIWLDIVPDNSKDDINNVIDDHEILSGNETFRQIKGNGGLRVIVYKNGQEWQEVTVNEDGTYELTVPKSDDGKTYNTYEVRFIYNGMDYTNVIKNAGNDIRISSKAEEDANYRTNFNNKFGTINGQSAIQYESNSEKTKSKYIVDNSMAMYSKTDTITLSIDTNQDDLKYYNLGLKRRPTFDVALIKDVDSATVTINGQTEKYIYDKLASYNPETDSFDEFIVKLRNGDFNYSLGIRDNDRPALNSVITTYSLRIINQSSIYGEATILKDYYDNSIYDVSRVYIKENNNIVDVNYRLENGVIIITLPGHVLGNNQSYYVYLDLAVKQEKINELQDVNNKLEPINYAEICEYKTYTDANKSSTPGIIDINSAPDNYSNGYNENDTGESPVIFIGDRDENVRKLTGNVFEDIESRPNITGALVQLVEITPDGNLVLRAEQETTDGSYTFERFLPGNYFVRFNYGNNNQTVLTTQNGGANATSYNGQDYKSTDYEPGNYTDTYWYLTVTDKSDAVDNEARRQEVNAYSKVITNYIAEVLNSWKSNPIDEAKVAELIEKTKMFADTATMKMSVEYGTETVNSNSIPEYNVTGVDFGLKKRPISEVELTKQVSKLTLKSSSGETLIEAAPDKNTNNVQWIVSSFVKVEQEDSVLNGANLEIEYTIKAKNIGEISTKVNTIVDYVDNSLRFDTTSNEGWDIKEGSELKNVADKTKDPHVNENIQLDNQQTIVVKDVNTELNVNEEKDLATITLTKTLTTSNSMDDTLAYDNVAEILATENDEGRKTEDSTPGNLDPNNLPDNPNDFEPGDAVSEHVSITNPTGQTRIYYVLGITIAVIMAAGVVAIKKFVLDKRA